MAEGRILQMLKKLWVLPVDIRLSAHSNKLRFRPRSYSYLGNVPVLDVFDRPITDWDVVMKWLFDKIVGGLALICAAPLMLLVAIAIKLDSRGPVFFKQRRHGFNNELVEVYKFRSLYTDMTDHSVQKSVTKDDPRVTRVGRFIRKTSLDELPQLINVVFKGNLSLVGPRPHAVNQKIENRQFDEAVDGYFARHRVKPGITGWAQINGWRGELTSPEKIKQRVEHDLYYIENWSLLFDFYDPGARRRWRCSSPRTPTDVRAQPPRRRSSPPALSGAAPGLTDVHRAAALHDAVAHRRERRHRVHRAEPLRDRVVPDDCAVRHRRADAVAGADAARACCWC